MPRPKKIRKKKSFMFTSRHYSMLSMLSVSVGLCSVAGLIGAILISFGEKGKPPVHLGGVGLFGMLGNIVGAVAAINCFNERDIYKWVAYSGLVINLLGMILWTLTIFWGIG